MTADWGAYLRELRETRAQPETTPELSLRPALLTLLRSMVPAGVTVYQEVGADEGQPDLIAKNAALVVGYGETKPPGTMHDLELILETEQLLAYRRLPNLLLTDYLHFMLLRDGVEVVRATLIPAAELDAGHTRAATSSPVEELLVTWLGATPVAITSPARLAEEMAHRARWLRDGIRAEMRREAGARARGRGADGPLRSLHAFFVANLMSDMTEDMFADAYAQTVAYGLFVARYHALGRPFDRRTAMDAIPTTTAFLRSSVRLLLDEDTVPPTVGWIVEDIVTLLGATSDDLVKRAGVVRGARVEDDAVIYFYERFLEAYDAGEREDRGVFYTYPPLVSYAVRATDETLVRDFDFDGLADGRVRLLDPAVGTGTFLVAAAERAIARVRDRDGEGHVVPLIREHLLPHLFGFELLPAPYAIAHLKLGSFYAEAGHEPRAGERVGVYLTNTLAAPLNPATARLPMIGDLIAETTLADTVKRETPLIVIIGNPPYSWSSHNREHIPDLMANFLTVDGERIRERNVRPLDDDYLRFLRWSIWKLLEQEGAPCRGVIALVTNSAYLSRPVMRGVRAFLLEHFDEIRVVDLHGNQRQWFRGQTDEKVFPDVQVGISISLFIRHGQGQGRARVFYRETRGTRREKFDYLDAASVRDDGWTEVEARGPAYSFLPRAHDADYEAWPALDELMPENSPGVISHRDALSVGFAAGDLIPKIREFARLTGDDVVSDRDLTERYELEENPRWILHRRRQNLGGIVDPDLVKPLHYRPFDRRVIYDQTDLVGDRRERLRSHLERVPDNIALVATRAATAEAAYAFVTRAPGTQALLSSRTLGQARYFPVFVVPAIGNDGALPMHEEELAPRLNLARAWADRVAAAYGARFSPEALLGYLYAILTSASYRDRFAGALEENYPRIPFTADPELFELLATEGMQLVRAHLAEAAGLTLPRLEGVGDLVVGEPRYEAGALWINATQRLEPVAAEAWNARVGGYAPLELWVRNRRGRKLTGDEARQLARIAASVEAGEALRAGIDPFVDELLENETLTLVEDAVAV